MSALPIPLPGVAVRSAVLADVPALETLTAEARVQGLHEVLALTRKPAFFVKLGFVPAEREQFPLKVWADCARCPRQNCCDEVAVVLRL